MNYYLLICLNTISRESSAFLRLVEENYHDIKYTKYYYYFERGGSFVLAIVLPSSTMWRWVKTGESICIKNIGTLPNQKVQRYMRSRYSMFWTDRSTCVLQTLNMPEVHYSILVTSVIAWSQTCLCFCQQHCSLSSQTAWQWMTQLLAW